MKHGKRYRTAAEKVEKGTAQPLSNALQLAKDTASTKFDESVEIHMHLGIDPKKGEQSVRGSVLLPHPTGSKKRIAAFVASEAEQAKAKEAGATVVGGEELIKQIAETQKLEFDVAVASPDMMKAIGRIAKILGPKGLMPSPKNNTVTPDVAKAVEGLMGGQVAFKNDGGANIHQMIGKASFDAKTLEDNAKTFLDAVRKAKPDDVKGVFILSVTVTTTMGPGIRVQV